MTKPPPPPPLGRESPWESTNSSSGAELPSFPFESLEGAKLSAESLML
eukprot:CAMPEP_0178374478 /NCGR_PEP_ID=MMETSP0689_2-20121128/2397_1 /TAXON_ID=160604 /ORGANISM="Amphidinium massartii, Strain CS-259" /LENGTH=47 /DNA_ID= /DNA_START= /DNA_END= /DNA_ORIENTATION=